ncbi:hypothetical protein JCM10213_006864 [Rhodosporidiobolus nylandii]
MVPFDQFLDPAQQHPQHQQWFAAQDMQEQPYSYSPPTSQPHPSQPTQSPSQPPASSPDPSSSSAPAPAASTAAAGVGSVWALDPSTGPSSDGEAAGGVGSFPPSLPGITVPHSPALGSSGGQGQGQDGRRTSAGGQGGGEEGGTSAVGAQGGAQGQGQGQEDVKPVLADESAAPATSSAPAGAAAVPQSTTADLYARLLAQQQQQQQFPLPAHLQHLPPHLQLQGLQHFAAAGLAPPLPMPHHLHQHPQQFQHPHPHYAPPHLSFPHSLPQHPQQQQQQQQHQPGSLAAATAAYGMPLQTPSVPVPGYAPPPTLQPSASPAPPPGAAAAEGDGSDGDAEGEVDEDLPVASSSASVGAGGAGETKPQQGYTPYTPNDPYINQLRAASAASSSGSPPQPSYPTFAGSLPPSLAAFTGLAPRAGSPLVPGAYQPYPLPPGAVPVPAAAPAPQPAPQPEAEYASDDSADASYGEKPKKGTKRTRSGTRAGGGRKGVAENPDEAGDTAAAGFVAPRPAGAAGVAVGGGEEGSRAQSVDSHASASTSAGPSAPAAPLPAGATTSAASSPAGSASGGGDPSIPPGPGFAPPRARRQTEIPAVEDDPSIRPYGCNYCALDLATLAAGQIPPAPVPAGPYAWRTIKELREHSGSFHKERQKALEEAGDEAVMMEMPFRCALDPCGKTFKSLAGLRFHFQNASANGHFFVSLERDEDTGEERATKKFKQEVKPSGRELSCPIGRCPKRFKQSAGLAYHLSHTPNHPITLSLLSTFEPTLQSKTKWWFGRLGKEWAPEE